MIKRYERTQYVDVETGEVIVGEKEFRKRHGADSYGIGEPRHYSILGGDTEFVNTIREFKIQATQGKLDLK